MRCTIENCSFFIIKYNNLAKKLNISAKKLKNLNCTLNSTGKISQIAVQLSGIRGILPTSTTWLYVQERNPKPPTLFKDVWDIIYKYVANIQKVSEKDNYFVIFPLL